MTNGHSDLANSHEARAASTWWELSATILLCCSGNRGISENESISEDEAVHHRCIHVSCSLPTVPNVPKAMPEESLSKKKREH